MNRKVLCLLCCSLLAMKGGKMPTFYFTLVILPDTQNYTVSYPDTYYAQTQWIVDSADSLNTVFVAHMGDMVQNIDVRESEWIVADSAHSTLDQAGIPYGVLPGNHDIEPTTFIGFFYDNYFPPNRFDAESWYGTYMGSDPVLDTVDRLNQNSYQLFSAGGMDFIAIQLSNLPDAAVLEWANRVLQQHSDKRAIISTHQYLYPSGNVAVQNIWDEVIFPNCNVFLMLNGHYFGSARRSDLNQCGDTVHQALQNFQNQSRGGDGWLRYYKFFPAEDRIEAYTYSPTRQGGQGEFWVSPDHQFELSYDMLDPVGPPSISFEYPLNGDLISPGVHTVKIKAEDLGLGQVVEVGLRRGNEIWGPPVYNAASDTYDFTFDFVEGFYQVETFALDDDDNRVDLSIAFEVGNLSSSIFLESNGMVVIEAENFSAVSGNPAIDQWFTESTTTGFEGSGYQVALPDDGTKLLDNYSIDSPSLSYQIQFTTAGTKYLWYRGFAESTASNSVHFGINGEETLTLRDVGGTNTFNSWVWMGSIDDNSPARFQVASPGTYTLNLWEREDGTLVDRILITDDPNFSPNGAGPDESGMYADLVRLNAKVILQGAYESGSMRNDLLTSDYLPLIQPYSDLPANNVGSNYFAANPNSVDWIQLSLRTSQEASSEIGSWSFLLNGDGMLRNSLGSETLQLSGVPHGEYFIVVSHRNHLAAMSPLKLSLSDDPILVDFSGFSGYSIDGAAQAEILSGFYALWSGDVNSNEVLNYSGANNDRVEVLTEAGGPSPFDSATGYLDADLDLDGVVLYSGAGNDRVLILDNLSGPTAFDTRKSQVPE